MTSLRRSLSVAAALLVTSPVLGQEPTIRSTAVVDLKFDETEGPAQDAGATGTVNDVATPMNGAGRVSSPFWNATSGRAARVETSGNRFYQIADSVDLDHAAGTTLSFFFLSLHELDDAVFHGIIAKRQPNDQGSKTNYGLNYQPSSKKLQVYIHDGSGFKVVSFPLEQAFGVRRLAHLTATFAPGDAPMPDADTDSDDLEIRLHVNGKPLKPMEAANGSVTEDSGWITDVNFAALPNDTPLTIGASFPSGETVSGLIDELLVFNRALTSEEASRLFMEVAGPTGEQLAKRELEGPIVTTPVLNNIVPRGAQIGATTRITVGGRNLGPGSEVSVIGVPATTTVLPESTTERMIVEIAIPPDVLPTVASLSVRSPAGLSDPIPLPVDRLPQRRMPAATAEEALALPAAFTGTLKVADRPRIVFDGKAGQQFVAEVELKRLGGRADPVLELKSTNGTPIEIAWGRSERGGDPRLIATLPHEGRYVLELHDLAFQAPQSPFRLLAGDLHLLDSVIPASIRTGTTGSATPVGVGLDAQPVNVVAASGSPTAQLEGPPIAVAQGVLPVVTVSDHPVLGEKAAAGGVDATSAETWIAGRLEAGESDRYLLKVTPGSAIEIAVDAKAIGSAVEPVVIVREQNREIGRNASAPGSGGAALTVTPQAAEGEIEVQVNDRLAGDGSSGTYRLRILPAGTPRLEVTLLDSSIRIPRSGRSVTRLRITRSGDVGLVRLHADAAAGIVFDPSEFPPGRPTEEVFVSVLAAPGTEIGASLAATAEADSPRGPLRRAVRVAPGTRVERFDATRPHFRVPIAVMPAVPTIELVRVPAAAFKGTTETIGVRVDGDLPEGQAVRFSIVTDEPPRPTDPAKPNAGNKTLVRLSAESYLPPGAREAALTLLSPTDVAVGEVRGVVRAEVVPHPWSNQIAATGYSAPFTLPVRDAVTTLEMVGSLTVKPGENALTAAVRRQEGFAQPLRVELRGLPGGYAAPPVELAADQTEIPLNMTVPAGTAAGAIPDVELAVVAQDGTVLKSIKPVPLIVQP